PANTSPRVIKRQSEEQEGVGPVVVLVRRHVFGTDRRQKDPRIDGERPGQWAPRQPRLLDMLPSVRTARRRETRSGDRRLARAVVGAGCGPRLSDEFRFEMAARETDVQGDRLQGKLVVAVVERAEFRDLVARSVEIPRVERFEVAP